MTMKTMKTLNTAVFAISMLASGYCVADAALLHAHKTIVINAPVDQVWAAAMNFDGLNTWHPAVAKDVLVEGKNNMAGAVRVLTLQDGGTIKEKLLAFDATTHRFSYKIVEGVLPVSNYTASFVVKSVDAGKSSVTWSGRFKRKDLSDMPADNANDKTALDTIGGVYKAGLDNLKKVVEASGK
jgi:mxaD protein